MYNTRFQSFAHGSGAFLSHIVRVSLDFILRHSARGDHTQDESSPRMSRREHQFNIDLSFVQLLCLPLVSIVSSCWHVLQPRCMLHCPAHCKASVTSALLRISSMPVLASSSTSPEVCLLCVQLWAKPGQLPQEIQSLAGGFTDAPNACVVEQDAPKGIASWWRYQGFKL